MHLNIVICNWRDYAHPKAGGAEGQTHILAAGLAERGHNVTLATSFAYADQIGPDLSKPYRVLRFGNEITCRLGIARWLATHETETDAIIDEVNTLPFLSPIIAPKKTLLWIHQLAREVWLAEAPRPLNYIGYALEPLFMRLYRDIPVITGAPSTAESLRDFGFKGQIDVIQYALNPPYDRAFSPQEGLVGFVGRLVPSKRVDHLIEAVSIARRTLPHMRLRIVGSGPTTELRRLKKLVADMDLSDHVEFLGRLTNAERDNVMSSFDVLAMTSMREGWGLVVAEVARYGVPSVGYPVAGLVDAIEHDTSGLIAAEQTPYALADSLQALIGDRHRRRTLGLGAKHRLTLYTEARFLDRFEAKLYQHAQDQKIAYS